jgi:hypothetical protein
LCSEAEPKVEGEVTEEKPVDATEEAPVAEPEPEVKVSKFSR